MAQNEVGKTEKKRKSAAKSGNLPQCWAPESGSGLENGGKTGRKIRRKAADFRCPVFVYHYICCCAMMSGNFGIVHDKDLACDIFYFFQNLIDCFLNRHRVDNRTALCAFKAGNVLDNNIAIIDLRKISACAFCHFLISACQAFHFIFSFLVLKSSLQSFVSG